MENDSNSSILLAVIVVAVLAAIFLVSFIAGGPRSDFNRPTDISTIEQALASRGLHACAQGDINWTTTPGFVSGKYYDVNTNCSAYDPNKPGARVFVAEFSSVEARDAALRNFETSRRHMGTGTAWSNGPLIIIVDGNQKAEVISILQDAVASTGAQAQ
jgi:hypothetical protein